MTPQTGSGIEDQIVVGYFSDGADALRAIDELIDEGFSASDIGAAFRTPAEGERTESMAGAVAAGDTRTERTDDLTPAGDRNPAQTGSIGGAGSHDEAVTPAGLAPGSGNAFPAPSRPGPIPGGELPSTLPHDLPSTLSHELPSDLNSGRVPTVVEAVPPTGTAHRSHPSSWGQRLKHIFSRNDSERGGGPRLADDSSMKFGTGEGHLELTPSYNYSESSFESSFVGMGIDTHQARGLSGELGRGGAVVSVTPGERVALAQGIIERNRGRLRFESALAREQQLEADRRVELFGRMHSYYRPEDDLRSRKAS